MKTLSRRELVELASLTTGLYFLPSIRAFSKTANANNEPHYLIQIAYSQGVNHSYLMDARPKKFTAAGLSQNFTLYRNFQTNDPTLQQAIGKESILHQPKNGGRTYLHPIAEQLITNHGKNLAIVNGVHMLENNDGHETNLAHMLTSSSADNGELMAGKLDKKTTQAVFSYILNGRSNSFQNKAKGIETNPQAFYEILRYVTKAIDPDLKKFLISQYQNNAKSNKDGSSGEFSIGSQRLQYSAEKSSDIITSIENKAAGGRQNLPAAVVNGRDIMPILEMALTAFKYGMTDHAVIVLNANTDDHGTALVSPPKHLQIVEQLNAVLNYLTRQTHAGYDDKSFLQLTTLMVSTEFNRTLRQSDKNIFSTGTDHNRFGNSIIFAGKGIRSEQVIGETDIDELAGEFPTDINNSQFGQQAVTSQLRNVSKIHLEKGDPNLVMNYGKPFDFKQQKAHTNYPSTYNRSDYITMDVIQNTLLRLFGLRQNLDHTLSTLLTEEFRNG